MNSQDVVTVMCPVCAAVTWPYWKMDLDTGERLMWARECSECEWGCIYDGGWWDEDADGRLR